MFCLAYWWRQHFGRIFCAALTADNRTGRHIWFNVLFVQFPLFYCPVPSRIFKYIAFPPRRYPSTFPFYYFFIYFQCVRPLICLCWVWVSWSIFLRVPVLKCCGGYFLWTVLFLVDLIFFVSRSISTSLFL